MPPGEKVAGEVTLEPELDIGALFAELTALPEDAAGIAAAGQGAGVTPEAAALLGGELARRLWACTALQASLGAGSGAGGPA